MTSNSFESTNDRVQPSLDGGGGSQLPMLANSAGLPAPAFPPAMSPWAGPAADDGINIVDYLHSLRRRWFLGLVVGLVLATLTAGLLWVVVPETFAAASMLHVRRDPGFVVATARERHIDDREYQSLKATQITLIKSSHVLAPALDEGNIDSLPMLADEKDQVGFLVSALQVSYPDDAEVLRIALRGEDKEQCTRIVDAVTESYLERVVYAENARETTRLSTLRREYRRLQGVVDEKTSTLRQLKEEHGDLDTETAQLKRVRFERDLSDAMRQRTVVDNERIAIEGSIYELELRLELPYEPSPIDIEMRLKRDERYVMAKADLDAAQSAYNQAIPFNNSNSPIVTRATSTLNSARQAYDRLREGMVPSIIDELRLEDGYDPVQVQNRIRELEGRLNLVRLQIHGLDQVITESQANLDGLTTFSKDAVILEAELVQFHESAADIKKQIDRLALNVTQREQIALLQNARPEEQSDISFKYFVVFGAAFIVMALSVVGFTLGDYVGKRVNSTTDISKNIHLPVVGTLPMMHGGLISQLLPFGKDSLPLKLQESIDSIRTAILYNKRPHPVRVVMVTSAASQEGKTTVASQLAVSLARAGRRTLLIDGDFQNPQQHEVFGLLNNTGFSDVLRGEVEAPSAVTASEAEGLWIMTAGYCDRIALQALGSPAAREKMELLKTHFDYIVLDAAPVLTGAESLLLGQLSDSALLSIRRDVSRTTKVAAACQRLESVGIDLLGGILNGSPSEVRRQSLQAIESNGFAGAEEDEEAFTADVS